MYVHHVQQVGNIRKMILYGKAMNQKIENLLNVSLSATRKELENSESLSTGFNWRDDTWEIIVKYSGTLENIRKKYMLAVTEEIEKNCEESAYMIQFGKARIAQKSIKQAVNYFKGASLSSFLLIGEFEQVDKLMELLPKLEKNYKEIANIINLVCDEKGKNKVIYLIQGMDGASLVSFSFGGES